MSSCGEKIRDLLNINQDIAVLDLNRIHIELRIGIIENLAGSSVVFPPVPWADDFAALYVALPQWPAHVQADVVNGRDCAVHISNTNRFAVDLKFLSFARTGELGFSGELDEGHAVNANQSRVARDASQLQLRQNLKSQINADSYLYKIELLYHQTVNLPLALR
jgi:hypothetical protein